MMNFFRNLYTLLQQSSSWRSDVKISDTGTRHESEFKSKEMLLHVLLKEYETIKAEGIFRLGLTIQIFQVHLVMVGVFFGFVVSNKIYDILLVLPMLSFGLFLRVLWEQLVGIRLGKYMMEDLGGRINDLLADVSGKRQDYLGWNTYFDKIFGEVRGFGKFSMFVTFGVISCGPALYHSISCLTDYFQCRISPSFFSGRSLMIVMTLSTVFNSFLII